MSNRKPDYSAHNIPLIKQYCKDNGLLFWWKNEEQGHAVVSSVEVDAYIWVQRMVVGVRMRNGVELSKTLYERPDNYQFSKKMLDHLLFSGSKVNKKVTSHTDAYGIKITRRPAGAVK